MGIALRRAAAVLAAAAMLVLSGCGRGRTAGQNLDRALDRTGEAVEDAGEALRPK